MSKHVIYAFVSFVLSLLFLASCATRGDVYALYNNMKALNTRLSKVEKGRESVAEAGAELDGIKEELRRISGELEENSHLVKRVSAQDPKQLEDIKVRLSALEEKVSQICKRLNMEETPAAAQITPGTETTGEGPPALVTRPPAAEGGPTAPSGEGEGQSVSPEEKSYADALALNREGRHAEAIEAFKDFMKTYPKSNLAGNAQFWTGESYMALKKYEQAILAYQEVITKYPNGNKVPGAMLKQAMSFIEIKDTISAKLLLQKLIKKYPNSDEAKTAEAKLSTLK
ncbi:putative Tol-pal system protein YbgF [uncultured Desulfobacterium sp.]|uniref:Putative Tol-pal system protein YbgF n=1 Tax=uncultured Desulfobacterium sp. TaxID=201089 RepID=A0A445MSW4_9BACT|nr:putative Tol-pal system protein YbgF [uncultured Desulfobacterium sp.]